MKYIIANWKQNKTLDEALNWCNKFVPLIKDVDIAKVSIIICPPVTFLEEMRKVLPDNLLLGVQDISPYEDGAHTGFVGENQIKEFCKYAIVGHSERNEPRDLVMRKADQCIQSGITPLICYKSKDDFRLVEGAIDVLEDPENISSEGVYKPKSSNEIAALIEQAKKVFGPNSLIIYGGSVNPENAAELASINNLAGVLVGNASLDPTEFAKIIQKFSI